MGIYDLITSVKAIKSELDENSGVMSSAPMEEKESIPPKKYETFVTDHELRKVTQKLFVDGHHARAVEEAYKFLNKLVKKLSGVKQLDGSSLMKQVFSLKTPILKLNAGTNQSEQDEQLGYMEILSGCMTGIRNPRAHEYEWEDSEERALQLLAMANHLIERVKLSANPNEGSE